MRIYVLADAFIARKQSPPLADVRISSRIGYTELQVIGKAPIHAEVAMAKLRHWR